MQRRSTRCLIALLSAAVGTAAPRAFAQTNDLLRRVPPSANVIVVMDVEGLINSPLGKKQGWADKYAARYGKSPLFVPPEARSVVVAAQINQLTMEPLWELAVMQLSVDPLMSAMARAEDGFADTVRGTEAVWTPRNAYFIKAAPRTLAMTHPANRQYVSRWLGFVEKNREPALSEYLKSAVSVRNVAANQIVMAMDLQDLIPPHQLPERLKNAKSLSGKNVNLDSLAQVLVGLQGVTLTVRVVDSMYGKIAVDFDRSVAVMAPVAKPMVLEALSNQGAALEDVNSWRASAQGNRITLEGALSEDGLKNVLSVFELPATSVETEMPKTLEAQVGESSAQAITIESSKRYFGGVTDLTEEALRRGSTTTMGQKALWIEKKARKIDQLPVLHVDQDLLNYGAYVSEQLRNFALTMKGERIAQGARGSSWYWQGGYAVRGQGDPNRVARAAAARTETQLQAQIDEATGQIRKQMTQRYQVEF
jgi:hypothetical protein